MAAMMGGTMRSPLTGILFAVELTGDFALLEPLLVATGAAYAVTVLLLKRSILTEKIARRGQHVIREYSIDPFELLRVAEVMVSEVDTLPAAMPIDEAVAFFVDAGLTINPIRSSTPTSLVVGMVSRADVLALAGGKPARRRDAVRSRSDRSLIVGYPDEPVSHLADRMVTADVGRVPIVEPRHDAPGRPGIAQGPASHSRHRQIDGIQPRRLLRPRGARDDASGAPASAAS